MEKRISSIYVLKFARLNIEYPGTSAIMNYIKIAQICCRNMAALFIGVLLVSYGGNAGAASTPPATYSISGTISGAVLKGVTITLTGGLTTTTDAKGSYTFSGLANGTYIVTPSVARYIFDPTSKAVSVSDATVSGTNFTATGQQLNDTGITASQCFQAGSDDFVDCGSAGAIALNNTQDGMVGRDANVATNNNADGKLGFSFSAVPGGCVQDNVTGLMWEVKTADGGLRDWSKTYTNYSTAYDPYKLYGTAGDASGFVIAVNASNLCGYSDWRLPTSEELKTIVDYGADFHGPAIDTTWFPNTPRGVFWTSTPNRGRVFNAFVVFSSGGIYNIGYYRSTPYYVRLVRAGQLGDQLVGIMPVAASAQPYVISADGTEVTDQKTGLIWRRCAEGLNWNGSTCAGNSPDAALWDATRFTHEQALQHAAAQASITGKAWRLPTIEELGSIGYPEGTVNNPAVRDRKAFPGTPHDWTWSSSLYHGHANYAWYLDFAYGGTKGADRNSPQYVRLVRSVQ
jgi:hypothetical protein